MEKQISSDVEMLWKRVGLDELRGHLKDVKALAERFEQALSMLPSCDQCAKLALLDHIEKSGRKLSSQVMNLTMLTESLRTAAGASENAEKVLCDHAPHPCQCRSEKCSCHHGEK